MTGTNSLPCSLGIVRSTDSRHKVVRVVSSTILGDQIMWTKPQATEMRFGFEVTMYVCNR
jgi:pyrroloquinoline quinone biosynthesis protein A